MQKDGDPESVRGPEQERGSRDSKEGRVQSPGGGRSPKGQDQTSRERGKETWWKYGDPENRMGGDMQSPRETGKQRPTQIEGQSSRDSETETEKRHTEKSV